MITPKMRKWIEEYGYVVDSSTKRCVYKNRIQKRIEKEINGLVWLVKNHSDLLTQQNKETISKIIYILTGNFSYEITNAEIEEIVKTLEEQEERGILGLFNSKEPEEPIFDYADIKNSLIINHQIVKKHGKKLLIT